MPQDNKGTGQREVISNVWRGKGSTESEHPLWGQVWSGWSLRQDPRARHSGRGSIQCKGPEVRESSLIQKWKGVTVARICWMRGKGKSSTWEKREKESKREITGNGKGERRHFPTFPGEDYKDEQSREGKKWGVHTDYFMEIGREFVILEGN